MAQYINPDSNSYVFTFASGSSNTQSAFLSGVVPVGLYIPAGGWNASSIAFLVGPGGGALVGAYQWQNGQRLELQTVPTSYVNVPYDVALGYQWIALQATYTGVALAQTGIRTVTAIVRPI